MATNEKRFQQDIDTLNAMGRIYCRAHHPDAERTDGLCPECAGVIDYSIQKALNCPFDHRGNCEDCDIHCYKPEMRAGIRAIMRYGAPRMTYQHPIMTMRYVVKKITGKNAI